MPYTPVSFAQQACLYSPVDFVVQAKIQGMFAAHAMAGVTHEMAFGFNFELFTHITRFCGRKVVLLGLYNGQGLESELGEDMVTYSRSTEVRRITVIQTCVICKIEDRTRLCHKTFK